MQFAGKRVLVMGYGLNQYGSGPAAALYAAQHGAKLTITDLRSEEVLKPNMQPLTGFDVSWVLGGHNEADFLAADIVIKNPGVRRDSPFLALAKRLETDLSLFLQEAANPIIAVTGSKGKSSAVSLISFVLQQAGIANRLGGNIAISPLSFLTDLKIDETLVLELSSWQAGDLRGRELLKPKIALLTNLLPDHQNYYGNMQDYARDKAALFENQDAGDWSVFNFDDDAASFFASQSKASKAYFSAKKLPKNILFGAFLHENGLVLRINGKENSLSLPKNIIMHPLNQAAAALVLALYGIEASVIEAGMAAFKGIEHRLEFVGSSASGIAFYNDSAATIPEAAVEAVKQFDAGKICLIFGGADKNIDFSPFKTALPHVKGLYLLAGSASGKIEALLGQLGLRAPLFSNLAEAMQAACSQAVSGDIVLLSPGAASYGMFLNEFDRGWQFKKLAAKLIAKDCSL